MQRRLRNESVQFLFNIKMGVFPGFRGFWGSCAKVRFVAMCHETMIKRIMRIRTTFPNHLNPGCCRALCCENV